MIKGVNVFITLVLSKLKFENLLLEILCTSIQFIAVLMWQARLSCEVCLCLTVMLFLSDDVC